MNKLPVVFVLAAAALVAQPYDLVIRGGRVMDPESKLDAVRHIGIRNGKIAAVSASPLQGKEEIDATGHVVAPGFIDLHAHGQTPEDQRLQARDGVTTALELEIGTGDVAAFYRDREGKLLINAGASVGHVPARIKIFNDPTRSLTPTGPAKDLAASAEQVSSLRAAIERGLQQGALGVGFGIQYTPAATRSEILDMFRVAARFKAPAFIHIRTMGAGDRDAFIGFQEILANSAITGVPVHMVHVTSSGLRNAKLIIEAVAEAQKRGVDVTTECYPYTAANTSIASAIFDGNWQSVLGIDYSGLQWSATGERLTKETFERYRKQNGAVIMHMIPEDTVRFAVAHPSVMIASDGFIAGRHPRSSGTFARVLGYYARDQKTLPLMEALRKMTLMPAQRLETYVPAMKNKGRIKVGADADISVFSAEQVKDNATFEKPDIPSTGIPYVLVGGVPVVRNGQIQEGRNPGRPIRAALKQ